MTEKRPALGKGLSALIPDAPEFSRVSTLEVDIDLLTPNHYQPRQQVDDEGLDGLARSIKSSGVIQPLIVRKRDGGYQIIAGERRWRAAQKAGLHRVPVIVKDIAPDAEQKLLQMALIENIQREDLNPIEEAHAYRRLVDEFQLTQDGVADLVGKDRSSVANALRLLKLPADVRAEVASGALSMGHARALLPLQTEAAQRQAARDILARKLSVRETEALVRKQTEPRATTPAPGPVKDVHTRAAEEKLRLALGTRVRINRKGSGGTMEVDFASEEELNRIYEVLTSKALPVR
jgi:ParB family chromosome partitioning protein